MDPTISVVPMFNLDIIILLNGDSEVILVKPCVLPFAPHVGMLLQMEGDGQMFTFGERFQKHIIYNIDDSKFILVESWNNAWKGHLLRLGFVELPRSAWKGL